MMEELSKSDEEEIKKADVAVASRGQELGDQLVGVNTQQQTPEQQQPMEVPNA